MNFAIDISGTIQEFSLVKTEIDSLSNYILDRVVDEYMNQWETLVNSTLKSTKDEYKRAMYTERPDDYTAIIGLTSRESKLALMIEQGASAFDEKEGFSKSGKKTEKIDGGWFLTIPFRHGTSESIMGEITKGGDISVLDLMKQGGVMNSSNLPEGRDEPQTHSLTLNTGSLITYKHKSPIYEGLHRIDISSTSKEKRGGYFTFRRVSDNSDPESWIHPGFRPHNFMDTTLQNSKLTESVDNAVQDWLDKKFD